MVEATQLGRLPGVSGRQVYHELWLPSWLEGGQRQGAAKSRAASDRREGEKEKKEEKAERGGAGAEMSPTELAREGPQIGMNKAMDSRPGPSC